MHSFTLSVLLKFYYIHAIGVCFPISHQYKRVIVIVYWSDYTDEDIFNLKSFVIIKTKQCKVVIIKLIFVLGTTNANKIPLTLFDI